MTPRPRRLGSSFEALEDRTLPTTFGIPWPDPDHLSLSFVPDGAATPSGPSRLYSTLNAVAPTAAWQREILRAYQTWAAQTNLDVRLVADAGYALGTPGAVQADDRFGDVRVAAAAHPAGTVAAAAPFSWTGTTFAGDMVMTTGNPFGIGNVAGKYDIFSVALHEAGHSLGLDHSDAAGSVMNEDYAYHAGLSGGDAAAVRALYGVRSPDAYDAAGGNDTLAKAVAVPKYKNSLFRYAAAGDVTTTADVDYYKFTVPALLSLTGARVQLVAAGRSLFTGKLTVYNSSGKVVGSATAGGPTNNDVSVPVGLSLFGGTYYVKVEGAAKDVFGVGGYQLVVDLLSPGSVLPPLAPLLDPAVDLLTNDVLGTATTLLSTQQGAPDARFDYVQVGVIETGADVDTYRVKAPQPATPGPLNLNVLAWGLGADPVDPRVKVFDAAGRPVAFQVLANDTGVMSVQVRNVTAGADYFVQVSAQSSGATVGRYYVAADFNQFAPTELTPVGGNTLAAGAVDAAGLTLTEDGLYEFGLAAQSAGGVTMTVTDAAGKAVLTLTADGGRLPPTAVVYLAAGTYTVRYTAKTAGAVRYDLFLAQLSEGVGPYSTSTSGGPPSGGWGGGSGGDSSGDGYTYSGPQYDTASYPYYF